MRLRNAMEMHMLPNSVRLDNVGLALNIVSLA